MPPCAARKIPERAISALLIGQPRRLKLRRSPSCSACWLDGAGGREKLLWSSKAPYSPHLGVSRSNADIMGQLVRPPLIPLLFSLFCIRTSQSSLRRGLRNLLPARSQRKRWQGTISEAPGGAHVHFRRSSLAIALSPSAGSRAREGASRIARPPRTPGTGLLAVAAS